MADTGWVSPGTVVSDDTIGVAFWYYPEDAKAADDDGAILLMGATCVSEYLKATNFGFSIPTGATINGIVVRFSISQYSTLKSGYDNEVKIVQSDGTIGSENKGLTTTDDRYPSELTDRDYGGVSDLWDETWSASDINDSDFGVVLSSNLDGEGEENVGVYVDHIQIKVYYTESAGTDTNSEISAKTTGSQTSNDELSGFLAGGHGRYVENFTTTTKKDGATTASWTGDGSAEMDTT